jgi:neutral ceramidase
MRVTNNFSEDLVILIYNETFVGTDTELLFFTVPVQRKVEYEHPYKWLRVGVKRSGDPSVTSFEVKPEKIYANADDIIITPTLLIEYGYDSTIPQPVPQQPVPQQPAPQPPPRAVFNTTQHTLPVQPIVDTSPCYLIGTGIDDVTDPAHGLNLQGFAEESQKSAGVESNLYARAFVIVDRHSGRRVALVSADIWSCSMAIKKEVIRRLGTSLGGLYGHDNLWIAGTHTHSGPGGYLFGFLYNYAGGGFDVHCFENIVSGIVSAVEKAHANLGPGRIFLKTGIVPDCGRNRSVAAYAQNADAGQYATNTDKEMLVLKFTRESAAGLIPAGMLCWYAIHPTDRGQLNRLVTGDNKGHASALFESEMGTVRNQPGTFIAAFANSNCGDVSGNVEFGRPPDGSAADIQHMKMHGAIQYGFARSLFLDPSATEVRGEIDFRHTCVDMQARTGLIGAIGLSMFAGSTEDGDPGSGLAEGITSGTFAATINVQAPIVWAGLNFKASHFGHRCPVAPDLPPDQHQGHHPKPIVIAPGAATPIPMIPNIIPFQILRIGGVAITGVPAELTTMAGRRLRAAIQAAIAPAGVTNVALGTYANDYCGYVTTLEEYNAQHYEGASNLFGPQSLAVYTQEYSAMAAALANGAPVSGGAALPDLMPMVANAQRMTIRNLGETVWNLRIFNAADWIPAAELPHGRVALPANADVGYSIPWDVTRVKISFSGGPMIEAGPGDMMTVTTDGARDVVPYQRR